MIKQILMATCHNECNQSFPKVVGNFTFSDKGKNRVIMIVAGQFSVGFLHFSKSEQILKAFVSDYLFKTA